MRERQLAEGSGESRARQNLFTLDQALLEKEVTEDRDRIQIIERELEIQKIGETGVRQLKVN